MAHLSWRLAARKPPRRLRHDAGDPRSTGPLWSKLNGTQWDPGILLTANPLDSNAGHGMQDFLNKTDVHTGLLVERAPGRFGYPHLTFQEYYAGRALAFEGLARDRGAGIRRRLHDPRYDEPILLALGLVGREQPEEINRLVGERSSALSRNLVSTRNCLAGTFFRATSAGR